MGVLLTAPEFRRGIDWLPANVIPHWFATYRTIIDDVALHTDVLHIDGSVEEARGWQVAPCRPRRLLVSGETHYYYESPLGWSLLVTVAPGDGGSSVSVGSASSETDPPSPLVPCEFVDLFVARFQFFQNVSTSSSPPGSLLRAPSFPAILSPVQ